MALLARRINGKYLAPERKHSDRAGAGDRDGKCRGHAEAIMDKPIEELKDLYNNRDIEK